MYKSELKPLLKSIKQNDYAVPETATAQDLLPHLLSNIGDLDGELRDELIFAVLAQWIYKGNYTDIEIVHISEILLGDEYLLKDLGNPEGDGIFTRAFVVLQFFAILYTHREKKNLPPALVNKISDALFTLIKGEKDFRGFVKDKGWGHSIAHTADAFAQLAQLPSTDKDLQIKILEAMFDKTLEPDFLYTADEAERLSAPVAFILKREEIGEEALTSFLYKFVGLRKQAASYDPAQYFKFINARNLLRGVFFRLRQMENTEALVNRVDKTLVEMNKMSAT